MNILAAKILYSTTYLMMSFKLYVNQRLLKTNFEMNSLVKAASLFNFLENPLSKTYKKKQINMTRVLSIHLPSHSFCFSHQQDPLTVVSVEAFQRESG